MTARADNQQRLMQAANKIGTLTFALDVGQTDKEMGTPDRQLLSIKRYLLPVLDDTLAAAGLRQANVQIDQLQLDLGNFPLPADWQAVQAAFRQSLISALAPHLKQPLTMTDIRTVETARGSANRSTEPETPKHPEKLSKRPEILPETAVSAALRRQLFGPANADSQRPEDMRLITSAFRLADLRRIGKAQAMGNLPSTTAERTIWIDQLFSRLRKNHSNQHSGTLSVLRSLKSTELGVLAQSLGLSKPPSLTNLPARWLQQAVKMIEGETQSSLRYRLEGTTAAEVQSFTKAHRLARVPKSFLRGQSWLEQLATQLETRQSAVEEQTQSLAELISVLSRDAYVPAKHTQTVLARLAGPVPQRLGPKGKSAEDWRAWAALHPGDLDKALDMVSLPQLRRLTTTLTANHPPALQQALQHLDTLPYARGATINVLSSLLRREPIDVVAARTAGQAPGEATPPVTLDEALSQLQTLAASSDTDGAGATSTDHRDTAQTQVNERRAVEDPLAVDVERPSKPQLSAEDDTRPQAHSSSSDTAPAEDTSQRSAASTSASSDDTVAGFFSKDAPLTDDATVKNNSQQAISASDRDHVTPPDQNPDLASDDTPVKAAKTKTLLSKGTPDHTAEHQIHQVGATDTNSDANVPPAKQGVSISAQAASKPKTENSLDHAARNNESSVKASAAQKTDLESQENRTDKPQRGDQAARMASADNARADLGNEDQIGPAKAGQTPTLTLNIETADSRNPASTNETPSSINQDNFVPDRADPAVDAGATEPVLKGSARGTKATETNRQTEADDTSKGLQSSSTDPAASNAMSTRHDSRVYESDSAQSDNRNGKSEAARSTNTPISGGPTKVRRKSDAEIHPVNTLDPAKLSTILDRLDPAGSPDMREALELCWSVLDLGKSDTAFWKAALGSALQSCEEGFAKTLRRFLDHCLPPDIDQIEPLRRAIARLGYAGSASPALRHRLRENLTAILTSYTEPHRNAAPTNTTRVVGERLLTRQSGLVLFHPYLKMLLDRLDVAWTKGGIKPGSLGRAFGIIEFLALGRTDDSPAIDPLAKHLLALEQDDPAPFIENPRSDDITIIDGLVQSVINQWGRLGNTSPDSLRAAFVLRDGVLKFEENKATLTVTQGPYDMLLDGLPWSINMVKLPWLTHPLHVKWRGQND